MLQQQQKIKTWKSLWASWILFWTVRLGNWFLYGETLTVVIVSSLILSLCICGANFGKATASLWAPTVLLNKHQNLALLFILHTHFYFSYLDQSPVALLADSSRALSVTTVNTPRRWVIPSLPPSSSLLRCSKTWKHFVCTRLFFSVRNNQRSMRLSSCQQRGGSSET